MAYYDTAQICLNGHAVTDSVRQAPERTQKSCDECGASTITQCPSCQAPVRGAYVVPGVVALGFRYTPPAHCHNCGAPYPWTAAALEAARELIDLSDEDTVHMKPLKGSTHR